MLLVDILLSTYNGEKYLSEQLDSILNQQGVNVHVIARDDGSSDDSLRILNKYKQQYPNNFTLYHENKNLGVVKSYEYLLAHSTANYIAFADQDDFWLPNKLINCFTHILELENDGKTPVLVYTDLLIVDKNLKVIDKSFFHHGGIEATRGESLKKLTIQNSVVGCTVCFNKALKEYSLPFPNTVLMHDWWLALCANYYGVVKYIKTSDILYRQHGNNVVGSTSLLKAIFNYKKKKRSSFLSIKQAESLLSLKTIGNEKEFDFLKNLEKKDNLNKKLYLLKNRVYKSGLLRNLNFFLLEYK